MKLLSRLLITAALAALAFTTIQCRRSKKGPPRAPVDNVQSSKVEVPNQQPGVGEPMPPELAGLAFIPGGEFTMGDRYDMGNDATPHKVNVSAFYMQKNLVTKAQWDEVWEWGRNHGYADLGIGAGKAPTHPVQTVTWYDVVKGCNALSEKEGLVPCYTSADGKIYRTGTNEAVVCNWEVNGYRLPTEAEWEKAARGGLEGKRFPWGDIISHDQANFCNEGKEPYQSGSSGYHPTYKTGDEPYTSPVGRFPANGYGIYDMAGNVSEWCWDWQRSYPSASQKDPHGPASDYSRVHRGGSWTGFACISTCANRRSEMPHHSIVIIGFRLARGRP